MHYIQSRGRDADWWGPLIRKVGHDGIVTILYGKSEAPGSDGPASQRQINASSMLLSPENELVFTMETAVKKITKDGNIVTISNNLLGALSIVRLFGFEAFLERRTGNLSFLSGQSRRVVVSDLGDPYFLSASATGALLICEDMAVLRIDFLGLGQDLTPFKADNSLIVEGSTDLLRWSSGSGDPNARYQFFRVRSE
jgi:hypothetical protein